MTIVCKCFNPYPSNVCSFCSQQEITETEKQSFEHFLETVKAIKIDCFLYKSEEILALCPWQGLPKKIVPSEEDNCCELLEQVLGDVQLKMQEKDDEVYDIFDVLQHHLQTTTGKFEQEGLDISQKATKPEIANFLHEHISRYNYLYEQEFHQLREFKDFQDNITALAVPTCKMDLLLQVISNATGTVIIVVSSSKERLIQTIVPETTVQATAPFFLAYLHSGSGRFISTIPVVKGRRNINVEMYNFMP